MDITVNTDRLIECRNNKGITKMEAAKRMKLSQPAYVRYENGDRTPSIQTLKIIANILDTSVEYLTNKTDNPSPNMYIITKEEEPYIFELIELINENNKNDNFLKRIINYTQKLSKQTSI